MVYFVILENSNNMENKINVAELLKDCPSGMELDCPMFENLEFDHIDKYNGAYPIICRAKTEFGYNSHTFTEYGCYSTEKYAKCVIFPKGKTSWEGFIPPCKFKDGDIVFSGVNLISIFKGIKEGYSGSLHSYVSVADAVFKIDRDYWSLENIRFATEKEKEKLFKAIKDNGYKWNAETKTLEKFINRNKFVVGDIITNGKIVGKICSKDVDSYQLEDGTYIFFNEVHNWELVPNKFDITTLKPFDKVLVRDNNSQEWRISLFSHYNNMVVFKYSCINGNGYAQCVPYEQNEHLLGTTNDCNEFYKTWEE